MSIAFSFWDQNSKIDGSVKRDIQAFIRTNSYLDYHSVQFITTVKSFEHFQRKWKLNNFRQKADT